MFEGRQSLTFDEYEKFNLKVSSEMFLAIMQVTYNMIPCTSNFFFEMNKFIESQGTIVDELKSLAYPTFFKEFGQEIITSPTNKAGFNGPNFLLSPLLSRQGICQTPAGKEKLIKLN